MVLPVELPIEPDPIALDFRVNLLFVVNVMPDETETAVLGFTVIPPEELIVREEPIVNLVPLANKVILTGLFEEGHSLLIAYVPALLYIKLPDEP
jgi:hypothetical protein